MFRYEVSVQIFQCHDPIQDAAVSILCGCCWPLYQALHTDSHLHGISCRRTMCLTLPTSRCHCLLCHAHKVSLRYEREPRVGQSWCLAHNKSADQLWNTEPVMTFAAWVLEEALTFRGSQGRTELHFNNERCGLLHHARWEIHHSGDIRDNGYLGDYLMRIPVDTMLLQRWLMWDVPCSLNLSSTAAMSSEMVFLPVCLNRIGYSLDLEKFWLKPILSACWFCKALWLKRALIAIYILQGWHIGKVPTSLHITTLMAAFLASWEKCYLLPWTLLALAGEAVLLRQTLKRYVSHTAFLKYEIAWSALMELNDEHVFLSQSSRVLSSMSWQTWLAAHQFKVF